MLVILLCPQGVSIIVSSGDNGANSQDYDCTDTHLNPEYPASKHPIIFQCQQWNGRCISLVQQITLCECGKDYFYREQSPWYFFCLFQYVTTVGGTQIIDPLPLANPPPLCKGQNFYSDLD